MDQSEKNEATLEKLIQDLRDDIEQRTNTFNAKDIAIFSGTIPYITTMLEYRKQRENFLNRLENMKHDLIPQFYSDELIDKCQSVIHVSTESPQSIIKFFSNEIARVKQIRQHVLSKFNNNIDLLSDSEITLENYMVEVSSVLKQYQLTTDKISSTTTMSYTIDDLQTMIRLMYMKHAKETFLKTLFLEFKLFPLTNRHLIVDNCFTKVEDDLSKSSHNTNPDVPFFLTSIEELNDDLGRLASRFGIKPNFEEEDGQLFLYYCDQKYSSIWNKITDLDHKKINNSEVGPKIHKSQYTIIDEELCKQAVRDDKIVQMLKIYFNDNDRDVNHYIKVNAESYNQLIGIKLSTQTSSGLLKRKQPLPTDRLTCWFRMRILYVKYLFMAILSYYNYFEALKQNIVIKKFKWKTSSTFPNLTDVIDDETDEIVILESAQKKFNDFKSSMISVISYYTVQYENLNPDDDNRRTKVVDKHLMIEKYLEFELKYCNAKQSIIQNLYECHQHQNSDEVIHQIFEIVEERPKYHVSLYASFDYSYKLAIEIMETQANLISTLYYFQIMHERQLSAQLPSTIPLFYRPILIDCKHTFRQFKESFPLSPFEVYQFLPFISSFLKLSKEVALDISEGIDFRDLQFFDYMHLSVLQRMKKVISYFSSKGIFPFEYQHYPFSCELSDSIYSLISSSYVNDLNTIEDLISSVPEAKKLRFCLTYIRFLQHSWKTQKLIVKSDLLQKVYLSQAAQNGISDSHLFVESFSGIATQELIDVHDQFTNEKLLEFALIDYEAPDFDFSTRKFIIKFIISGDFTRLQRIHQFQKFHCFILEIAARYNNLYLDNQFLITHFGLETEDETAEEEEENDIDLFLTQAGDAQGFTFDNPQEFNNNTNTVTIDSNLAFIRSFLATKILYDSQYIVENIKKANTRKEYFFLNIHAQKLHVRSIVSAQAKVTPMKDEELYNLYFSEMVDAFSAFSYRLEIANVCRLERQVLLMNSFADAFIIESTNVVLVNEAGRVQNHFVVPSWADTLFLVRTAPLPRQAAIFKVVLEHVTSLYQILHLIRFEASLTQKISRVSLTLWDNEFHLETSILQKLLNELTRLPSGNEFDVSSKYLESKLFFLMERLELALFQAYQTSYVSVSGDDVTLGPSCLSLYQQMTEKLTFMKGIFNSHRFIPNWMTQFMGESIELNRSEILRQLMIVDQRVDTILAGHQLHSVLESSQAIVASLDFIAIALLHERIKLCYFILLSNNNANTSSIEDPFVYFTRDVFLAGLNEWKEKVVPDAARAMVPKDDSPISFRERPVPEEKVLQAEIDIARSLCDNFMLTNQIEEMKRISDLAFDHFSKPVIEIKEKPPSFSSKNRPKIEDPSEIDKYFKGHLNTCRYLIVKLLMDGVNDITAGSLIQMDHLEKLLNGLSLVLSKFTDSSILQLPHAWHFILKPLLDLSYKDRENDAILEIFNNVMKERFIFHLFYEIAARLSESIFELNRLNYLIYERKHQVEKEDIEQDELITAEYEHLVYDLGQHQVYLKTQFKKKRDVTYSLVLKRIEQAAEVKFEKESVVFNTHETHENKENKDALTVIKDDIENLRINTRKMRIFRCISGIAEKRYFTKRIKSLETDRVHERAKLWQSKRDFELVQAQKLEELRKAYRKLADDEIEIERLKQQLDNEKQSTIQLVHWKALNTKKEDQIQKELKKYTEVEKVNIGELLKKLNAAKAKLEKLNQETEYIETETERTIRTPMKKAEQLRKKIFTTKLARNDALKAKTMPSARPQTAMTINTDSIVAQYRDENVQLMSRNEHLLAQIELLENTREQMPQKTVAYMSEVVPSGRAKTIKEKGRAPKQQVKSAITRPRTAMTPRKSGALDQLLKTTYH